MTRLRVPIPRRFRGHTGETGATWTKHTAAATNYQIAANRVRDTTGNAVGLYTASGTPATAEYDVIGTLRVVSVAATELSGVAGRIADAATNTMILARYVSSSTAWQLANIVAGSLTQLSIGSSYTLNAGTTIVVRLAIRNGFKGLYVDGVLQCSSTDNTVSGAGLAGIRGFCSTNSDASGIHYDTFQAVNV
jgi:hypothetical protein